MRQVLPDQVRKFVGGLDDGQLVAVLRRQPFGEAVHTPCPGRRDDEFDFLKGQLLRVFGVQTVLDLLPGVVSRQRGPEHEAHGFHLKEYTIGEVAARLRTSGFETINVYPGFRRIHREVSRLPFVALETVLDTLPASLRQKAAKLPGISSALLSTIVARKRSS